MICGLWPDREMMFIRKTSSPSLIQQGRGVNRVVVKTVPFPNDLGMG